MSDEDLIPRLDGRSDPFFQGAREGRLMLQRCGQCHAWLYPVRVRCTECGGTDVAWAQASGRGRVYAHGRVHRPLHPAHEARLPLVLATIDLDEGVRMLTNLVDVESSEVRAGMEVEAVFESLSDDVGIPYFKPMRRS